MKNFTWENQGFIAAVQLKYLSSKAKIIYPRVLEYLVSLLDSNVPGGFITFGRPITSGVRRHRFFLLAGPSSLLQEETMLTDNILDRVFTGDIGRLFTDGIGRKVDAGVYLNGFFPYLLASTGSIVWGPGNYYDGVRGVEFFVEVPDNQLSRWWIEELDKFYGEERTVTLKKVESL